MRKIKFRAIGLDGKWYYGDLRHNGDGMRIEWETTTWGDSIMGKIVKHGTNVKPETVGQFTGKQDKNGNEIYEGDILLIQAEGYDPIESEVTWGGIEYPAFDLPKYDGYGMNAFSAIYHNDVKETLEVIGNIYEEETK